MLMELKPVMQQPKKMGQLQIQPMPDGSEKTKLFLVGLFHLPQSVITQVVGAKTAFEAWRKLERTYASGS